MTTSLLIPSEHWRIMLDDVIRNAPHEACGLLFGIHSSIEQAYPIQNMSTSKNHYQMNPKELVFHMLSMDVLKKNLLGIYHSHPNSPPRPSSEDLINWHYPDTPMWVWGKVLNKWQCKAYSIHGKTYTEIPIEIVQPKENLGV